MANPEHVEIFEQGAEAWNAWCKFASFVGENRTITRAARRRKTSISDFRERMLSGL